MLTGLAPRTIESGLAVLRHVSPAASIGFARGGTVRLADACRGGHLVNRLTHSRLRIDSVGGAMHG